MESNNIKAAVDAMKAAWGSPPQVLCLLGSGWKEGANAWLQSPQSIPLTQLQLPEPGVQGHGAEGVLGTAPCGTNVACLTGRVHAYEGRAPRELVRAVRAFAEWGCPQVIITNAAGSLQLEASPGGLMMLSDHINLGLPSPLAADQTPDGRPHFLDLVDLYDPTWRASILRDHPQLGEGVYVGLPGPHYETPAEVRRLQALGGSAVGMSTIPEAIAARAAGMKVLGLSLLTNWAAGLKDSRPNHEEVLEVAQGASGPAAELLQSAVRLAPN